MINYIVKNEIYKKFREFRSFFILLFLTALTVIAISTYDNFKSEQLNSLEKILQNIYLQKTLQSYTSSLQPRFEKINHIVNTGESLTDILNELSLDNEEKIKVINFISDKKIKFNLYENQKISFEIDNLNKKKNH